MGTLTNVCVGLADIYFNTSPYEPIVGNEPVLSKVTVDVTSGETGDKLTINGTEFTQAIATDAETHAFQNAAGLVTCVNDATYGLDGVTASAVSDVVTLVSASPITLAAVDEHYITTQNDWTKLGFQTEDGLTLEYTSEFSEPRVAEIGMVMKRELLSEDAKISFMLQESDLEQMGALLAGATYTAGNTPGTNPNVLGLGGKATTPEVGIAFVGVGPNGNAVVGYMSKAVATAAFRTAFQRTAVREMPAEFQAVCDSSRTAGQQLLTLWEITSD